MKKLSYSKYMLYHVAGAGILGILGDLIYLIPGLVAQVISLICLCGAVSLLWWGMKRPVDEPDELTLKVISKSNTIAILVTMIIALFFLIIEGITKIIGYSVQVDLFKCIGTVGMMWVWLYMTVMGLSYKKFEEE